VTLARPSGNGVQVGQGELERRVGSHGEAQRLGGSATVDGSLCLPVKRRGLHVCGDGAAVVLNDGTVGPQVIMLAEGLALFWLHESQCAWLP
jgi:hypothetical protein